jgi:hypothetical protein
MHTFIEFKRTLMTLAFAVCATVLATGCGSGPRRAGPVDAKLARDCLQKALESWKNGELSNGLRDASPSITVQDMDWKTGYTLVTYEILGDDKEDAANLHCPVRLTLRDPRGREVKKKVTYVVGTDPVITVFREMSL